MRNVSLHKGTQTNNLHATMRVCVYTLPNKLLLFLNLNHKINLIICIYSERKKKDF